MPLRVVGHEAQRGRLAAAWQAGRLAHAYLFVGQPGIGKRTFARHFARSVLCHRPNGGELEPCGDCGSCRVFESGGHPDYFEAEAEKDRHEFRIDVIRDLLPKLGMKPALGDRRVAVVSDVERFNEEAANAFLKTLEEPPRGSLLLLVASGVEGLLPTIRSRCQTIAFSPLSLDETAEVLRIAGLAETDEAARRLAAASGGSIEQAEELADENWRALQARVEERLAVPTIDLVRFAKDVNKYCESAGKEAAEKRRSGLRVVRTALRLYEVALRVKTGGGPATSRAVAAAADLSQDTLLDLIERTLDADEQVKRYLHLATTIDCWIDDLAQIAAGTYAPAGTIQSSN